MEALAAGWKQCKIPAMKGNGALVVLSGGLDSVTTLYWALARFKSVEAFSMNYGQKHALELDMAAWHCQKIKIAHHVLQLPLQHLFSSALLQGGEAIPQSLDTAKDANGLPLTYVPFRNGILLSLAAGLAESRYIDTLVTGFNLIDSPDYPDTTAEFTMAMEKAIRQGTGIAQSGGCFRILTPLLELKKSEIIQMGLALGIDYAHTLTCYRGLARPCLTCPACEIRQGAFVELGILDPLLAES